MHAGFFVQPAFIQNFKKQFPDGPMIGIEHAALSYLHIKQLVAAVLACPLGDSTCQSAKLSAAPAEELLGFAGWHDHAAEYSVEVEPASGS